MRHWIFIRGLGKASQHWGDFVPRFREAFPGDQIEMLDLAGNGSEKERLSFLNIATYREDLRSRSQWIRQGKAVHLMTISLASMISVDWAIHYPKEIAGIVMMNTSDRRFSKFYERMQPTNLLQLTRLFQTKDNQPLHFPATNRGNFFRQLIAASLHQFPEQKPAVPLLLLSSLRDQLCHPICSARIAEAWGIPHRVHPTASHDIPLDDAAWVIEETRSWLSQLEAKKTVLNV
jgi:pimeloyl-ACP methyl ester carboxylesterase